ncbi:MAG: NUDIX domain-containing protein [Candidatus Buchananbacteria bacterium]
MIIYQVATKIKKVAIFEYLAPYNIKKKGQDMEKKVAFVPGRYGPSQKGHIQMFIWLLNEGFDIVIGIGSCYEVGRPRHPILAVFREKMIRWSLINEGVDMNRVSFVHLRDFDDWQSWWNNITSIPQAAEITHFVTGNEKEITAEVKKRGLGLNFKFLNPEKEMPPDFQFPYHATDLRQSIIDGDYERFTEIASSGTIALMSSIGGFRGIRQAMLESAPQFVPGRQTVDLIIICEDDKGQKKVLCGKRNMGKENFPGYLALPGGGIDEYESPFDAAIREIREETGLVVEVCNSHFEPAHIKVGGVIAEMKFVGLFGTADLALSGNQGGSSQVFCIDLDAPPERFNGILRAESDLDDVRFRSVEEVFSEGLAYQYADMLRKALAV